MARSCSHLDGEGQGSAKQKGGGDAEQDPPVQLHGVLGTASPGLCTPGSAAATYTSRACSARPGHPAPANGNPGRKQTAAAASGAGLAPGHGPALRCRCHRHPEHSQPATATRAALQSRLSLMPVLPCASSASWRVFPEMFGLTVTA